MKSTGKSTSALLIACVLGLSACGSSTPAASGSSTTATTSAAASSASSSAALATSTSPMVSSASSSAPAVVSSAAPTVSAAVSADSSPASSSSAESSAAAESTTAGSTSASAATSASSTRSESTISGSGGVIKAGAAQKLPAKVGGWVKAAGSGPGTTYNKGNSYVTLSFLPGADYAGISTAVTNSKTKVGTGICGSTSVASNLTCYLKTADGVLNASSDGNETPLVALVDFVDQLTTILGKS